MGLKVVGAGLGRTGTHSLKLALEQLLDGPCYHMVELFPRPEHVPLWHAAVQGREPDWAEMLEGFVAAVDWPAAAVWRELHVAFPDSVVLLSVRDDSEAWWRSFSQTILQVMEQGPVDGMSDWYSMSVDMLGRLTSRYAEHDAAIAAYESHNQAVRDSVSPERLIEWRPADGWAPICTVLGIPEPDEPFPHVNTTDEFRLMAGLADTP
ncbi:MAG TPA: sulfotransferase [Acidimicrobiales bacterium]|nr:sulfotransferase [Acidimicrobiales bacterium]